MANEKSELSSGGKASWDGGQIPSILLGKDVPIPKSPEEASLQAVFNPHPDVHFIARFTCPEFTSLCPVTGQPDFANIVVDYAPDRFLVESKSLKLFLFSFRNYGGFHEDCIISIGKHFREAVKPHWLRIGGYFNARGGIPIDVFWSFGKLPDDLEWVPEQGVNPYRSR
jgi:7-cyano-7-deazaguanine reductase